MKDPDKIIDSIRHFQRVIEDRRRMLIGYSKISDRLVDFNKVSEFLCDQIKDYEKIIDKLKNELKEIEEEQKKHRVKHCIKCAKEVFKDGIRMEEIGNMECVINPRYIKGYDPFQGNEMKESMNNEDEVYKISTEECPSCGGVDENDCVCGRD